METYTRDLHTKGETLYTDSSTATRLSQRPGSQRKGVLYEDFGSDFGGRSSSRTSQPPRSKLSSKPASSSQNALVISDDDSSEDELDFLSSHSRQGSASPVKTKKQRQTSKTRAADAPPPVVIDHHQKDPNYRPLDLSKLRIGKKSSAATSTAATPKTSQDSHPKAPQDSRPKASLEHRPKTARDSRPNCVAGPSSAGSSTRDSAIVAALDAFKRESEQGKRKERSSRPLRERSPNQDRSNPAKSYLPDWDNSDEEKDAERTPRPSRLAPRPTCKGANSKITKSQTMADMSSASQEGDKGKQKEKPRTVSRSKTLQAIADFPLELSDDDISPPKHIPKQGKARLQAVAKSKPTESAPADTKFKDKGKQREVSDPIDAIFASKSPPRSPKPQARKKQPDDFPMPSPLSSPAASHASSPPRKSQTRSHRVVVSSDDEESETGGRSLRPFPMETQFLESLKRVSPAKRSASECGVHMEGGASRKRPRRGSRDKMEDSFALDKSDSDSDLDNMFLDPSVDPKTLCPWCDERLPSTPTPYLVSLIDGARRRSYIDERPTNPLGLRAPPAVFVSICQRHRFERVWIPRARKRKWPTHIDWGKLRGRIEHLKGRLQAIVGDADEDFVPGAAPREDVKGKGKEQRPRKENEFWQEVVKNVREQGSRQTTGVRGQFLHFNKTQPGYYGELGYVIIHQTLCDLFPPASFDPAAALPLTPADFIGHVLVPEAAVNLIVEDLGLSRADAITTLRESVEYGVAMFPADEGEGGKGDGDTSILTAGERIIMERARARRKELEEEERREEEDERRAQQTDAVSDVDMDMDAAGAPSSSSETSKPKPKPKPRPIPKRKPPSSEKPNVARAASRARSTSKAPESGEGIIELSSDTGGSTDVSRSGTAKRRRKARDEPPSSKSDAPSDAGGATPRAKPKPRPRAAGRAALGAASQPDMRDGQRAKADLREPASDPIVPHDDDDEPAFMSWDRKPASQVHRGQTESSANATPRPKSRAVSAAATETEVLGSSGANVLKPSSSASATSRAPLQIARERRQAQAAAASSTSKAPEYSNGWLPTLRGGDGPSSDDDERSQERPDPPLKAIVPQRKGSQSGKKDGENEWAWLLSDGSSAGSRTSSFGGFD